LLLSENFSIKEISIIPVFSIILFLLGSFTKRAQFPFINWLPAAIAAPTPISSLVHSSTLVTAGVYLVIRFFLFIARRNFLIRILIVSGIITLLFAGAFALFEKDLKKVIALSTLRHLGLIITSCCLINPLIGFLHLIIHAIFKALLFINIGYCIIISNHNQDRRLLRKVIIRSEFLSFSILFSLLRIIGFFFFSGFFSKDIILFFLIKKDIKNIILFFLLVSGFVFTASYSIRFC
jgi:NADH-ubiquinone oxidoreductase chain 5